MKRSIRISALCEALHLDYRGMDTELNGLNLCNRHSMHDRILSYVTGPRYREAVEKNRAVTALAVSMADYGIYKPISGIKAFIICDNPEECFYDIHDFLAEKTDFYDSCEVGRKIGDGCHFQEHVVIEEGVVIGNHVSIGHHTVVRRGTRIGDYSVIGCNTTLGSEGFQVLRIGGMNRKIAHCGGLNIGEHVAIGDNVTVCNSLFEDQTFIGDHAKIDNLVHVGHNVCIGSHAVITAGTILCGGSCVEDQAWIGVNASVLNRVVVGKNAKVGIGSVVTRDIPDLALAYGVPAKSKK